MPDAPLTCLDLWCRAGSRWETHHEEGMAHFLEHMVFKGSRTLPAGAFDREIEALGGSSNAATGLDDVHFHVLIPSTVAIRALELLLELVLHPAIAAEEFDCERDVVLEEIAQCADQPDERVLQELLGRACPNDPYGRPILGLKDRLMGMTPEAMRDFHGRRYRGPDCCLAIAGPALPGLKECLDGSVLAGLPSMAETAAAATALTVETGRHEIHVDRLESARFLMLWPMAPAMDQSRVMGADLATSLLGEGRRSRLVSRLREELQIAETVDMDLTILERGSLVTLEVCCRDDQLIDVESTIHRELAALISCPVTRSELERAVRLVGNGLRFALESCGQVAGTAAAQSLWGREQPLLNPLQHLEGWTADNLQEVLFPELQVSRACTLIARPGKQN